VEDEDEERRLRQDDREDNVRERGRVLSAATSEGSAEDVVWAASWVAFIRT